MTISLEQLATLVSGELFGDGSVICTGANPPGQATFGDVTMLDDPLQSACLAASNAIAVVTKIKLPNCQLAQIVVDDARQAFATVVSHFRPPIANVPMVAGIDPTAQIDPAAQIHPSATIGANVIIGPRTRIYPNVVVGPNCQIGSDCVIHAGVSLYEYSVLRDRVILHSNCVIGANGFGYRQQGGRHIPSSQLGYVEIESDVEVGAIVTIDRGTYGATRIGEGTKIDNQVQVAHNCIIGRHNLLCSQVGIAGSCRTGDHVVMAGQVGLKDHVVIGDRVVIAAQSGVMNDLEGDGSYFGSPAVPKKDQMQLLAVQRKLPEMRRTLKSLQRAIEQIEKTLDEKSATDSSSTTESQPDKNRRAA